MDDEAGVDELDGESVVSAAESEIAEDVDRVSVQLDRDGDEISVMPLTVSGSFGRWYNTSTYLNRDGLKAVLADLAASRTRIDAMTTTPAGSWVVVAGGEAYYGPGFPFLPKFRINNLLNGRQGVQAVDFNAAGGWVVVGDGVHYSGGAVPGSVLTKLDWYHDKGYDVRDVDITENGYIILGQGSLASYSGIDGDLAKYVYDRRASKRTVQQVEIGFDGRWAAVAGQEPAYEGLTSQMVGTLKARARAEQHVQRMMIGVGSSFVVYTDGYVNPSAGDTFEAIEYGSSNNLWERLDAMSVPGLSIAVVENHKVIGSRGYGLLHADQEKHILATTPFDLASLSKYIGAITAVRLDYNEGQIDMFEDILDNPGPNIAWWRLVGEHPNLSTQYGMPGSPDLPDGMTADTLLRHRAAIFAEGGSPGFRTNAWSLDDVNTLDLLLGLRCGTNSCNFNSTGTWTDPNLSIGDYDYASGNHIVLQGILEDATGDSFGDLMDSRFFGPMGLDDITGQMPVPGSFLSRMAWQHDSSGARSSIRVYPWVSAGGVNASARDYAEMMILALNQGRDSKGIQRVSATGVAQMLDPPTGTSSWGLFADNGNAQEGTDNEFRHNGRHGGRARTWMCGNPTRGEGIVVLLNGHDASDSDGDGTDDTDELIAYILDQYTSERGWTSNCR